MIPQLSLDMMAISSAGICWYASTFAPIAVRKLNKSDLVD